MNDAGEAIVTTLGMLGVIIAAIFVCVVGLLGFLLPIFVYQINGKMKRLNDQIDALVKVSGGNSVTKSTNELLAEVRTQNNLQRQLIRAYGHEPEV